MEMIAHQAVRVNLPICFGAGFTEGLNKSHPIGIVADDRLLPVAAADDVVNRSLVFDSKLPGPARDFASPPECVISEN